MFPLVAALEFDQIKCTVNYKKGNDKYRMVQTCPSSDKCFKVSTEDMQKYYPYDDISDASGSMCITPRSPADVAGCKEFSPIAGSGSKYNCREIINGKSVSLCDIMSYKCTNVAKSSESKKIGMRTKTIKFDNIEFDPENDYKIEKSKYS